MKSNMQQRRSQIMKNSQKRAALEFRQFWYLIKHILPKVLPLNSRNLFRLKNAIRDLRSRGGIQAAGQPMYAQIEPTTACNLTCRFCLNRHLPHPRDYLLYEQFVQILNGLPGLLAINLQGLGEPTMNKDIFKMASEARRRKIYVFTVTNLNLSKKMIYKLADSEFDAINISIESVDPEKYAWYRRGGDIRTVVRNLKLLGNLKKKNGRTFSVGIWTIMTEETIGSIESIFEFASQSGLIERIQTVFLTDKASHASKYEDALRTQQIVDRNAKAKKVRAVLHFLSRKYGIFASLVEGKCSWPWSSVYINAQGLLSPCCNIRNRDLKWGDVAEGNIDRAWYGTEWDRLRKGLVTGKPYRACAGCPYV